MLYSENSFGASRAANIYSLPHQPISYKENEFSSLIGWFVNDTKKQIKKLFI